MSYGFRAVNNQGTISVDGDSTSYVYLGKTQFNPNIPGRQDIYVHCVGYPLIFFEIFHGVGGTQDGNYAGLALRWAVAMTRLRQVPGDPNTWIVTMNCNFANGPDPNFRLNLRVFGLLHLNYPNGSNESYGARAWDAQGKLTFDTGFRQLKLAGNTYDTELPISSAMPNGDSGNTIAATDTAVAVPFDMANKSIMANTRGIIAMPYQYGAYIDFETNQTVEQWVTMYTDTGFWSNGSTLYARKFSTYSTTFNSSGGFNVVSNNQMTYTRVAVIDNNSFP
jgi:hypothetical protein